MGEPLVYCPVSEGPIVPAEAEADLSASLVESHRRALEARYPAWGARQADSLARQRAAGALSALLWRPPGGDARALTWVQCLPGEPRVHGLWLDPVGPTPMARFLEDLERDQGAPVGAFTDVLPWMTEPEQSRFFLPRGYWHRAKVLMRREGRAQPASALRPAAVRRIEPRDLSALVGVYLRAYAVRPKEFWTWGPALAEAEHDILDHLGPAGGWTTDFRHDASFVWEEAGRVLGVVMVEAGRYGVPYVNDLIVEPEHHRRGIGRALLESSLYALTRAGPQAVELAAMRFGAPYRLYTRLGFEEVRSPEGQLDGAWVRGTSPF